MKKVNMDEARRKYETDDVSLVQQYEDGDDRAFVFIEGRKCFVDELVAETFLSKPIGATRVHHKDGNIRNNCADNLEWV